MKEEESAVLVELEPLLVLAANVPLLMMLKMAQFGLGLKSTPNPTCWFTPPPTPKVATNSSERPAPKVALVPALAPSTDRLPPDTVAVPPVPQGVTNQLAGKVLPANSWLSAAARITSPSAICETA